jgi:hypothetical protein
VNEISLPNLPFDIKIATDSIDIQSKANIDYIKIQSILKVSRHKIDVKMLLDNIQQIEKDVPRTTLFNNKDNKEFLNSLRLLLITFAAFHQNLSSSNGTTTNNLGYTQGFESFVSATF